MLPPAAADARASTTVAPLRSWTASGSARTLTVSSRALPAGTPWCSCCAAAGAGAAPMAPHTTAAPAHRTTVIVRSGLTGNEQIATTGSFTLKAEIGKGEASHEH